MSDGGLSVAREGLPGLDWREVGPRDLPVMAPPSVPLKTLRRALRQAQNPVILVNDAARLMPRDLPDVVGTLWQEHNEPTVLVATGSHAADAAFYRDRLGGLPAEIHDARDVGAHIALDSKQPGVRIDRRVADADLILAWGSVEPHYFAGWTGAHKTATVGVLQRESIESNHANAVKGTSRPLVLDGNPVFDGLARILASLEEGRRVFAINQVLDEVGAPLALGVGTWRGSLNRCLKAARARYVHDIPAPVDVLVARVKGTLARSLYQADKGLKNNEHVVKDGGDLILVASLEDGVGQDRFLRLLEQAADHEAALRSVGEGYVLGDHKAVRWRALEARGVRIRLVSAHLDPSAVEEAGIVVYSTLAAALEAVASEGHGDTGVGLFVNDAGNVVCSSSRT